MFLLMVPLFNLTSQRWLPGLDAYSSLPLSSLPTSFDAVRFGLSIVLSTSTGLAIWIALRIVWPPEDRDQLPETDRTSSVEPA
jgi:hypothetical protein